MKENGYICFYRNERIEIYAEDAYSAQIEAAIKLGVPKNRQHNINPILAEKGGKPVVHLTSSI
jgi:hypothetical protein